MVPDTTSYCSALHCTYSDLHSHENISPAAAAFSKSTDIKIYWLVKTVFGNNCILNNSREFGNFHLL
jgi:hypothetical protein